MNLSLLFSFANFQGLIVVQLSPSSSSSSSSSSLSFTLTKEKKERKEKLNKATHK